ncbi:spore cortex-lytic enzyme [Alicyclobacillus dauci]|uniref:Spore cortex-lytic enzyme n=1 Tax=Alicyclobacillus dauci TaxID=1475485 RepID=A0ABY6YWZ4_9BACL|nr:spore cortex-lytic enzyme [Alicyclobacillus dauci]WAH35085.1 spore cortex-lytic enzyme [Alicyclobacillus dauci]
MRKRALLLRLVCAVSTLSICIPIIYPKPAYAFTAQNLMYGSQGYDVDELQGRLRLLGYYWGKIDGQFGWKTYWSVRTFQYNFGLKVTGEVDMPTKRKLVNATPNWHSPGQKSSNNQGNSGRNTGSTGSNGHGNTDTSSGTSNFPSTLHGLSQHDLNLMAHVVYGEARGESFVGEVAIAAVIVNRLKSTKYPNSVPAIVYQPGAFSAVSDGQVNLAPDAQAKRAVMEAVQGYDPTHGATAYFNPAKTNNPWVWSRPEIITIGHHIFTS